MGCKSSKTHPPPYQWQENDDEKDKNCVIEELQHHFKTKVLASLCHSVAEHEMFKLYILAKMYGVNIPVSLKTPEEFEKMSDQEKETHNRLNMGLISLFLGSKWVDT